MDIKDRKRTYIAIDLKSFYASVECVERGLEPLNTNLVVADESRTEKTICLAVSPALKEWGVPGRPRLFEVLQRVKQVNNKRLGNAPGKRFKDKSVNRDELLSDPALELSFITAVPRMSLYMKYSTDIYSIYLRYVAPADIHVYSVDEVFMDVTEYLKLHGMTARELTIQMIRQVRRETGITATAGIGTNLYLCKIAMDIVAKHIEADEDGVRIAELDEMSYRRMLWTHEPLNDFWRVGRGYVNRLKEAGLFTMGDIARCSLENEEILYKMFGINAELLIDHAWGYEPCTIEDIKAFKPENNSLGEGQVLSCPYTFEKAKTVVREMADKLAMKLMEKGLVSDQIVLTVSYDNESLKDEAVRKSYRGEIKNDYYGRPAPKPAHGSVNLGGFTMLCDTIVSGTMELYDRIVDKRLLVRRLWVSANHVRNEDRVLNDDGGFRQMELFEDFAGKTPGITDKTPVIADNGKKLRSAQEAALKIRQRYGNNAILKGTDFKEGATLIERNRQIGGHRA